MRIIIILSCIAGLFLSACSFTDRRTHQATNVMEYLYPRGTGKDVATIRIPHLTLPINVGVAFVPGYRHNNSLTSVESDQILRSVKKHFEAQNFISDIKVIPDSYMQNRGGFDNLDQLETFFNIDVIALISIDQKQFTDSNFLSLSYWTVIGAYLIEADKNDTHTMVDTVVIDIPSRSMLFRAPGVSKVQGRSSLINQDHELREDSVKGIKLAVHAMLPNLELELDNFKARVKNNPQQVQISDPSGVGNSSLGFIILMLSLFAFRRFKIHAWSSK